MLERLCQCFGESECCFDASFDTQVAVCDQLVVCINEVWLARKCWLAGKAPISPKMSASILHRRLFGKCQNQNVAVSLAAHIVKLDCTDLVFDIAINK